jgi:hypothetical protein
MNGTLGYPDLGVKVNCPRRSSLVSRKYSIVASRLFRKFATTRRTQRTPVLDRFSEKGRKSFEWNLLPFDARSTS